MAESIKKAKKERKQNSNVYAKGKETIFTKTVFSSTGEKIKTIKRTEYSNGVVKEKLISLEKELGGGKKKRIR